MPTFINNTITANFITYTGTTYGGGIFVDWGTPSGQNNIIYGNSASTGPDCYGTMFFNYSCSSTLLSGIGNITDNPMFVNPAAHNFNLQAGSPCIDTGDPSSPLDPDSTRADMGALYFDQSATNPDVIVELTYVSGSPVPPGGGNLTFDVYVANQDIIPADFDAWLAAEYAGGPPTTLVMRSFTSYMPGWAINRPGMFFPIPGSWAAGGYMFWGRVGSEPSVVWDESGFPFVKLGSDYIEGYVPTPVAGAPNPFDKIDKSNGISAGELGLISTHPNPFNPSTVIRYQLSVVSFVKLSIYDVGGRKVAELVNGWRDAGMHEVTFDASTLPSGVYFAQLNTGAIQYTQKLLLVK
jgi:hypothetical protein